MHRNLFLFCCLLLAAGAAPAAPRVVTSIAPVYEITSALMQGVARPELVVEQGSSSHHFALRPSHMRLLQQADLVIWIDRRFESGFGRIAEVLPRSTQQLELLPRLAISKGSVDEHDGHIWYSPRLLKQTVALIAASLAQLDPENSTRYSANAKQLQQQIDNWRAQTMQQWQDLQPRFITDHAFTGHFENDLGIRVIAALHNHHDDHAGIRELNRIEAKLQQTRPLCLLTLESGFSSLAQTLVDQYDLKVIRVPGQIPEQSQSPAIIQRLSQLNMALLKCT